MDFISWNDSRRSRVLSSQIKARYFLLSPPCGFILRQILCCFWTVWLLIKIKPSHITIQYSFLLLLLVRGYQICCVGKISIICDCHTKALRRLAPAPFTFLSLWIKRHLFRGVDHIFVHTAELLPEALALNKSSSVLIDPIPEVSGVSEPEEANTLVFVCSFSQDEPIDCIVDAAKSFSEHYNVYITGNMPSSIREALEGIPTIFTGFLAEKEYYRVLARSTVIVGLTTEDQCLQCSGYEALSFAKPYVTSDTTALRTLFGGAAIYTKSDARLLEKSILEAIQNHQFYKDKMHALATQLRTQFGEQIKFVQNN